MFPWLQNFIVTVMEQIWSKDIDWNVALNTLLVHV